MNPSTKLYLGSAGYCALLISLNWFRPSQRGQASSIIKLAGLAPLRAIKALFYTQAITLVPHPPNPLPISAGFLSILFQFLPVITGPFPIPLRHGLRNRGLADQILSRAVLDAAAEFPRSMIQGDGLQDDAMAWNDALILLDKSSQH